MLFYLFSKAAAGPGVRDDDVVDDVLLFVYFTDIKTSYNITICALYVKGISNRFLSQTQIGSFFIAITFGSLPWAFIR